MTKKIYDLAFALHQALEEHQDVILLKDLEAKLNSDAEVTKLYERCESLQLRINSLLEYLDVESNEVKALRKELSSAKYALDINSLVKAYNEKYKKVRDIYSYVSTKLFDDFCESKGCKCL
mgnify:FL=1